MYITCTSNVHHMYITCTSNVHHMYITCMSNVHHIYKYNTLHMFDMRQTCVSSQYVPEVGGWGF